jgi:diguanylate cyclase (GGDEF)-like protein
MSDSENPQSNPEPVKAPDVSVDGQAAGAPQPDLPLPPPVAPQTTPEPRVAPQTAPAPQAASEPKPAPPSEPKPAPQTAPEPQAVYGSALAETTPPPSATDGGTSRFKRLAPGRKTVWATVAVLCLAGGTAGSLVRAHKVVRADAAEAQQALHLSSAEIALRLKLAIQHEEDLAIGAGTFFAGNPKATPAEFSAWAKWSQTLHRFPQLEKLSLVTIVRGSDLPAFSARIAGQTPVQALESRSTATSSPSLRILPSGTRPFYCLTTVELARSESTEAPAGLDFCAVTPGMLLARDGGQTTSVPVAIGHTSGLEIQMPVYRGAAPPHTLGGRMAAFVGWMSEVLAPGVMLEQALKGHPGSAVRIRYRTSKSHILFTSGTPKPHTPSTATNLHDGWTVRTFGTAPATSVLTDASAREVLIAGTLLSMLLSLLVFALGAGRVATLVDSRDPQEDLYDELTGLPNRALMLDRAQRMLARAGRESGLLVGALFIDIDWFQDVNDKLGQATGDQLLKIVAERLENVVREQDSVGRLGGDEFVILVESAARGARLDSLARRVIEALHKPAELDDFGPNFLVTASIGVAFGRYATADDMLRDARLALLAAKAAGKDRYTLFNANMRSVIEGRGVLEAELNAALQEKQFFLLYEPIFDLSTRRVVGLEALVRWMHPKQGVLLPSDFGPLAEETELIVPIGRWVLEQACSRAAAWNVAGHSVGISVEVSGTQINRDGFVTDVRRALQQSGIDPSLLTLEIPEHTVMQDVTAAAARLAEIKQMGVRVAINDFGSAYANHSDLQRLPLDFLKVDRSSLAATDDEDYRKWLLEAILVLGRDLSLTVVAKGIETEEQMITLHAMGCALAQGPFMGAAAPAKAIEGLFDAKPAAEPGELPTVDPREAAAAQEAATATATATAPAVDIDPPAPSTLPS